MQNDEGPARLNLVQEAIRGGNVTIVLGPSTARGSINIGDDDVPSLSGAIEALCREERISATDQGSLSHDDIIDYCTRNESSRQKLDLWLRQSFAVKKPSRALRALTSVVWHRIFTFDVSNALELSYRHNSARSQTPRSIQLFDPVTIDLDIDVDIEIIKLFGDVNNLDRGCYLNTPRYQEKGARSPWLDVLADDIKTRPIVFAGENGDGQLLINIYRQLKRGVLRGNLIVFIAPDLAPLQVKTLAEEGVLTLQASFQDFTSAVQRVFPDGRTIVDILTDTYDIRTSRNNTLALSLLNDFHVMTRAKINELIQPTRHPVGGIRRFYRGDDVTWRDVADAIHADLTPYRNFRNRIELAIRGGLPAKHLFLLTSPAGLGKTVGLMGVALWIRNLVNVPVLWFRSDGSLSRFFKAIGDTDLPGGAYVFVDDIANYADEFDGVSDDALSKLCIIGAARETRWLRYGPRIQECLTVVSDQIRPLNRADAEEFHDRIKRFGTLVHFHSADHRSQIDEILERSKRDLLVLVKELGLGERFEKTLQSEVEELTEEQRFAYLLVCIPDRIQVSLPLDLFNVAVHLAYPNFDPAEVLAKMGRLI